MNNMLRIIFQRWDFFPPQDIGSLMLSLNLLHPLLNEVRTKMVISVSRSAETASHSPCRSLSLHPLSLYCFLSETETSCPHTDGWTFAAICLFCSGMLLNNGIFFNPCPRIKLHCSYFLLHSCYETCMVQCEAWLNVQYAWPRFFYYYFILITDPAR